MNKTAANLLYLTIYNPTLSSLRPRTDEEDEDDVQEQAQILFYTSKERAVSRDRMLRQVGLAKALVNFSDVFSSGSPCSNVHSHSKRMVMMTPEPNFWIHAGIELAKTPRPPPSENKPTKGKDKAPDTSHHYDHHESSVHDTALREDLRQGYEQFKLTHGSLTSILLTLGQQALELQLERFWTVWAWSWDIEAGHDFGDHLGLPLHPLHKSIRTILDQFDEETNPYSSPVSSVIITPSHIIPSTRFREQCPPSLTQLLVPLSAPAPIQAPPQPSASSSADSQTVKAPSSSKEASSAGTFLGMPAVNLNSTMDVRKWNWPGYLTFGKSPKKPKAVLVPKRPTPSSESTASATSSHEGATEGESQNHLDFDRSALEDAMVADDRLSHRDASSSSSSLSTPPPLTSSALTVKRAGTPPPSDVLFGAHSDASDTVAAEIGLSYLEPPVDSDSSSQTSLSTSEEGRDETSFNLDLHNLNVHLSAHSDPLDTRRQRVLYMTKYPLLFAVVGPEAASETEQSGKLQRANALFTEVYNILRNDGNLSASDVLGPTAAKILEPKDRSVISTTHFSIPENTTRFSSRSIHLYNIQQLLERDTDISEVFSRGQNPQHWHVGKRDLRLTDRVNDEHIFMEVFRKEASLTDVDNSLASILRKNNQFS